MKNNPLIKKLKGKWSALWRFLITPVSIFESLPQPLAKHTRRLAASKRAAVLKAQAKVKALKKMPTTFFLEEAVSASKAKRKSASGSRVVFSGIGKNRLRKAVAAASLNMLALSMILFPASSARAESLWMKAGERAQTHYADHRAVRAGDILTVVIKETTNITATKETKSNKTSTVQDAITSWFFGSQNGKPRNANASGINNYDGKGNITDQQEVDANIAVMVTDVLPNGNFVIEGVRSVVYSNEKQYMILQGIVRADDITANNTVLSTQIANATVDIKEEGDLASGQRKGWLLRLNDFLNPF